MGGQGQMGWFQIPGYKMSLFSMLCVLGGVLHYIALGI